jgi:uncharacterized membrane protein YkvA (DUF1232 family)
MTELADDLSKPLSKEEMETIRKAARDEQSVRARFWEALARIARNTPFAEDLVAAFYAATDPNTELRVRATLLGALAYFILPLDFLPDFAPLIGFSDDAAVLALALKMVADAITPAHRQKAKDKLKA